MLNLASRTGDFVKYHLAILCALLPLCTGCPQYRDSNVPGDIRQVREPSSGRDYFAYSPIDYDQSRQYALIVVCHGTKGFDSARRQIGDWVKLAEEKQFIVLAPKLDGVNGVFIPKAKKQLKLQQRDEQHILACIRHVRAGFNIAADRIFLTGWSGGGFAVLHTGLGHPDLFRAIAIMQGNFQGDFFGGVGQHIDPYQPVYVAYGSNDVLTGREGQKCVEWLHEQGAAVTENEIAGPHKNHPKTAYRFFERVVRKVPWLHISAVQDEPDSPLTVRFKTLASFAPRRFSWTFGDGGQSPIASPTHTYAREDTYTVSLEAEMPDGLKVRRAVEMPVPQLQLLPVRLGNH